MRDTRDPKIIALAFAREAYVKANLLYEVALDVYLKEDSAAQMKMDLHTLLLITEEDMRITMKAYHVALDIREETKEADEEAAKAKFFRDAIVGGIE